MKLSKKLAIGASVIWVAFLWLLGSVNFGGSGFLIGSYNDDEEFQLLAWVIGLGVIWALYYLFRDNID